MFPTFTGSSRRPRNVNLSGQRHVNPFAAHALAPSTGSAASKTVAVAQAGRRQRQQEREELKSAKEIQRTWRGHKARKSVRDDRHQALASMYSGVLTERPGQRLAAAFPLVLTAVDVRKEDDRRLLEAFLNDLVQTGCECIVSGALPPARFGRLAQILIAALDWNPATASASMLDVLVEILQIRPRAFVNNIGPYYRMLAKLCAAWTEGDASGLELLQRATKAPLGVPKEYAPDDFAEQAYHEFTASYLTCPLVPLEKNVAQFSQGIDFDALAQAVVKAYQYRDTTAASSPEQLMWLLAHFIALQRGRGEEAPRSPLYLKAIYTQLSGLSGDIRLQLADEQTSVFVSGQIRSLVDKDEVTQFLDKFKLSQPSGAEADYASLLAGYAIVLIRCFPDKGDDIRMRLFLADFPTNSGPLPAVQFFWTAASKTRLVGRVLTSSKNTLDFLLQRKYFPVSSPGSNDDSPWNREWRTVLLFLELYVFVMRLTDDEDFFSVFDLGAHTVTSTGNSSSSRLRSSALRPGDLKRLTLFLKNLAFTLYYHSSELLQDGTNGGAAASMITLDHGDVSTGSYSVISGVDFGTFKSIVSTATQMLYERDSRRPFLPKGHWLMTSNFDMGEFLSAVVLEEQRQHELREQDSNHDDDESDDDGSNEEVGEGPVLPIFPHGSSTNASLRYAMLEKLRKQHKKRQRERTLASIGPKLEILRNMPYALPFDIRVQIFKQFVYMDKQRRRDGHIDPDQWRMHMISLSGLGWDGSEQNRHAIKRHMGTIERDYVFDSAFQSFYELGEGLKEPIQIVFVDQFGNEEAGIDGGGVTKEFLTSVTKEAFSEKLDYFVANKENALFPNPIYLDQFRNTTLAKGHGEEELRGELNDLMRRYEFLGRIVGKCMYEGILIDVVFAGFFLLKWSLSSSDAAHRASINDLREMDEDLYQGMLHLKNYTGDVSELGLDFTIEDQVSPPGEPIRTETRNLMPNGADTPVTNENRPLYISYVTRHRLVAQPYLVTKAFLKGLGTIIDPAWLRMFNQNELQRLVGGDSSEIDVADLRRNTVYAGVYEIGDDGQEHPTVQLFWDVMKSLADADRRLLLKYVTSTPRAPLLGFSQLSPKFSIRDGGSDESRLPSASTCVNLLKLPRYSSFETMKGKVLYAIRSGAGFDLS